MNSQDSTHPPTILVGRENGVQTFLSVVTVIPFKILLFPPCFSPDLASFLVQFFSSFRLCQYGHTIVRAHHCALTVSLLSARYFSQYP